jgi:IS30 family transposase
VVADRRLGRAQRAAFWERIRAGLAPRPAALAAGVGVCTGARWFREAGGVIGNGPAPAPVAGSGEKPRFLTVQEREEIAVLLASGVRPAQIAVAIGRPKCTISRELSRNTPIGGQYRALRAQDLAEQRAKRPKPVKLAVDGPLRAAVQDALRRKWSPGQISASLKRTFPELPEMWVSHETIYQALYVQSRGALKRELAECLRTGRVLRKPRRQAQARRERPSGAIKNMVSISDRPPEVEDRAVPGDWEGDLILGWCNKSQIGTLVERQSRFVMLLHLPGSRDAVTVAAAMTEMIRSLPAVLRGSLTWDQGKEMAEHERITLDTKLPIYFADPHSPWQRGTNENTNGLLRQYFPKGTDLSKHSPAELARVAAELNERPRKTLDWQSPAEFLQKLLSKQT